MRMPIGTEITAVTAAWIRVPDDRVVDAATESRTVMPRWELSIKCGQEHLVAARDHGPQDRDERDQGEHEGRVIATVATRSLPGVSRWPGGSGPRGPASRHRTRRQGRGSPGTGRAALSEPRVLIR